MRSRRDRACAGKYRARGGGGARKGSATGARRSFDPGTLSPRRCPVGRAGTRSRGGCTVIGASFWKPLHGMRLSFAAKRTCVESKAGTRGGRSARSSARRSGCVCSWRSRRPSGSG